MVNNIKMILGEIIREIQLKRSLHFCYTEKDKNAGRGLQNMSGIAERKKLLRKEVKKKILNLPYEYCKCADAQIFRHAVSLTEFSNAGTVFCYVGTEGEIDTIPILQEILKQGKTLGVPKCISDGVMQVYEIKSLDELEEGSYGIPEPGEGCRCIDLKEIELAFVPCLTCSRDGKRLGYGGGYYDRYLEKGKFLKAALCREALLEEEIPIEKFDIRMDVVISEEEVIRV